MKRSLPFYLILWFFMAFLLNSFSLKAQTISYPTVAQPLTRGLDSSLLTAKIDFSASCSTSTSVTINLGATNSPGTVEYIPGSLLITSSVGGVSITQGNISNLSSPQFNVTGINSGSSITFTIKRKINCGAGASTKDAIVISGSCNLSENDPNINTYNINAPALTLTAPSQINNANIGSTYNRTFSVTNGGNGCLDTLFLWLKYPAGGATLNSLTIGTTTLTAAFTNGDSTLFKVSGSVLGNGNQFCNGTTLTFTENVTLNKCNINTSYGVGWNDFTNSMCATDVKTSAVTMQNSVPILTSTLVTGNDSLNYCFNGTLKIQTVRITNSGTGPASNVQQLLRTIIPGSYASSIRIDTTGGVVVKNATGTIIGTIHSFSNFSLGDPGVFTEGPTGTSCVGNTSYIGATIANLGNIVIPANSFIDLEVKTRPMDYRCTGCQIDLIGWVGLQTQSVYKNQCATATYTEALKTLLNRAYTSGRMAVETPTDVVGGQPFTFKAFLTHVQNYGNPNGTGSLYFKINLTGTGMTTTATTVNVGSYTIPVNVINDTLIVGPFPVNGGFGSNQMNIPLVTSCGSSGLKTLNYWYTGKYSSCSPEFRFACKSTSVTVHCPDPCPKGGATPMNFTLKRVNYGLPDNNNDGVADASGSIDLTKIDIKHAVNGDTLLGNWNIKIYGNLDNTDPNFAQGTIKNVYVDFRLTKNNTDNLGSTGSLNYVTNSPIATIYPAGGGAPIICNNVIATITNTRYVHFEIPNTCRVWQAGDSIVFSARFTVNEMNSIQGNSTGFTNFVTNNMVYGSYTAKSTNQSAPIAGETYTCSSFNDYVQMSYLFNQPYMLPNQNLTGCNNTININPRQYIRSQESNVIFPYEVRTFSYPNIVKVLLPTGMVYRPNTAIAKNQSIYNLNATAPIADATISQVGDTLIFSKLGNLFEANGGTLKNPDEYWVLNISFDVNPTCATTSGLKPSQVLSNLKGNGVNIPLVNSTFVPQTLTTSGYNVALPQPVLSGGSTYNSSDGIGRWTVVLQNQSNSVGADNSWFYFDPKNSFTNIVVKEGTTTILPNANGFYQLGTLANGATRTFNIEATIGTCSNDSLRINSGYTCANYPNTFLLQSCTQTQWLKMINEPTQIQISVATQPASPIDLCASNTAEFVINSALAAYSDNPQFVVTIPSGLSISNSQIEWPLGSNNWQTVTGTAAAGQMIYNVESHSALVAAHGTKGLPGTNDNPGTAGRQAKLRITFMTDCNFVSGTKLTVAQRASRPCGDLISYQLGYNNLVQTNPVNINGVTNSGSVDVISSLNSSTISCNSTTVSGSLTPVGLPFTDKDTLIINTPIGVVFNGSFTSTSMVPVAGYPQAAPGGGQILKAKINPGTQVGASGQISYSYDVSSAATSGCGNFQIITNVERTGATLNCNGTPCPSGAKSIVGTSNNNLTVTKNDISITNVTISGNGPSTGANTFNVTIKNNGSSAINANNIGIDFFCGNATTPFASNQLFPASIAANATVTATMQVTIPGTPTCSAGSLIKLVANPATGSNCLCSQSQFVINTPLPVNILSYNATKAGSNVINTWTVARELNVKQYHIEHSTNGTSFTNIGTVAAVGNSNYSFVHENPVIGANYYRLIVEDFDGAIQKTVAVKVIFDSDNDIKIYPNPAKNVFTIELPTAAQTNASYQLFDVYGRTILEGTKLVEGKNNIKIDHVTAGSYYIKLIVDGVSNTYKLTIVK